MGQTLALDLALQVQSTTDTVTVTGEAPIVDPEKTDVSQVVSAGLFRICRSTAAVGKTRVADAERDDRWRQRLGQLSRNIGPLQFDGCGRRQQ